MARAAHREEDETPERYRAAAKYFVADDRELRKHGCVGPFIIKGR